MEKKNLLPKFLFKGVKKHITSLGDNPAFPPIENFDYYILKKRLKELNVKMEANDLGELSKDNLMKELSKLVQDIRRIETPIRKQLEMVCENAINRLFAFPNDIVNFSCELVDKVTPNGKNRITPEDKDSDDYQFEDLEDIKFSNTAIAKRRLINSLIQGGAHTLVNEYDTYAGDIHKLNPNLMGMYHKLLLINEYLTFVLPEDISDKHQHQGAYVQVSLGTNGDKTVIKVQGINFPLLFMETIRGFLELFSSHGLPNDASKAKYIIRQSDFLAAEPFDIRFGTVLWDMILPQNVATPSNTIPYYFMKLCKLKANNFNKVMQEMLGETKRGERLKQRLLQYAKDKQEYSGFINRINARKLNKAQINDGYFTAAELDVFNEDNDEIKLNEAILFESRAEDNARALIKNYDPEASHEEREDILNQVRETFPLLRSSSVKRYIYGVTKFWINSDIERSTVQEINTILKYFERNESAAKKVPASLAPYEYAEEFTSAYFETAQKWLSEHTYEEAKQRHYNIVKISTFEEATKYNKYLLPGNEAWCITWSIDNYDSYVDEGRNLFYFCLEDGFENMSDTVGPNCPLDDYGLSMIAILVGPRGELVGSTTRWNHERGGSDHTFASVAEVEKVIGVPFASTFKPRAKYDILSNVLKTMESGLQFVGYIGSIYLYNPETKQFINQVPYRTVHDFNEEKGTYIVDTEVHSCMIINNNGEVVFEDNCIDYPVNGRFIATDDNNMEYLVDEDTYEPVSDKYDEIDTIGHHGFCNVVGNNGQMTYMDANGKLIYNGFKWFEDAKPFSVDFGLVTEDDQYSLVTKEGKLIDNGRFWFDQWVTGSLPDIGKPKRRYHCAVVSKALEQFVVLTNGVVVNKKHPMQKVCMYNSNENTFVCIDFDGNYVALSLDDNIVRQT